MCRNYPLNTFRQADFRLLAACRTLSHAEKLCAGISNIHPASVDVTNTSQLDEAVSKSDVVISLIPYTFHADVIKSGIRNKKNVVTSSYVSPAMLELEKEVKEAGITVMNEIGLDPGIGKGIVNHSQYITDHFNLSQIIYTL